MAADKPKKEMPKGGRKGGTRYPRYVLADAVGWAKKLVSKTHLSPQPEDIIFASVVEAKSATAQIKVSTLRQYGLMQGTSAAYEATPLARAIANAPHDELQPLLAQAALSPPIFKALFDTFHGDEYPRAKIRQRAADLQVHPDQSEQCVDIYVAALEYAGLGSANGDKICHRMANAGMPSGEATNMEASLTPEDSGEEVGGDGPISDDVGGEAPSGLPPAPRAVFHVNVNLDASLDTEKLQRQLELLKRFGAI